MAGKIMNKVLYFMGIGENLEEQEETEEVVQKPILEPVRKNNVVNMPASVGQMKLVLIEPTGYDDVQDICDNLKNNKPVVINFENLDKDVARRMVDFISGTVYAIDGTIQKVSNGIIIAAPENVDILGSISNVEGENFDFEKFMDWLK